jgi:diaminohydroxyphosphoribosylaminopyrimidine deaminase/5-amino-6-(5-phosphoribosylamino)uracil reductase
MMISDEQYMQRCLELARKGAGFVAPNPMVGAVLVCQDRIIGEGWHEQYGQPHAEVNAIRDAIDKGNESLISQSTLYVSLEPCAHHGKTPPCDQLIIQYKIPRVIIGCRDPFPAVNGKGIDHLINAGIDVVVGVWEDECIELNKRFFCFHIKKRPYIILKCAQTADGFIGSGTTDRLMISGEVTNQLVHRWRSEEAAIMVGSGTVALDNPQLTNRSGTGSQPVRVVLDRELKLPTTFHVFDGNVRTIILNQFKNDQNIVSYVQLNPQLDIVKGVCEALYKNNIQSVLIEGGARLLSLFIESGYWDEARVITNTMLKAGRGVAAPELADAIIHRDEQYGDDKIIYWINPKNVNN